MSGGIALVTGGTKNLGRSVALTLAGQGYDVAVTYLSDADAAVAVCAEIAELGRTAHAVQMDLGDAASVADGVGSVLERAGWVNVLVNCAAIRPRRALLEITDDEWRRVIDVNLTGPFLVSRAVAPEMIAHHSGAIVNIAGLVAYIGGGGGAVHIAASKAGLLGLTRALADELGPYGIRVNTVVAGRMETTRAEPVTDAKVAREIAATSLRRVAAIEEVAATCAYLVSPAAAFVTGQAIHVNGGFYKS